MKVYIAGPMRGIAEFNFPAFMEAEQHLLDAGHMVFNPARRDVDNGFTGAGLTGHEDLNDGEHRFDLREALGADVEYIAKVADAICVLPGWTKSSGAKAEMHLAAALGLSAGYLGEFLPKDHYADDWTPLLAEAADLLRLIGKDESWDGPQWRRMAATWRSEPTVEIGGVVMPQSHWEAATAPFLSPDPGPTLPREAGIDPAHRAGEIRIVSETGGEKGSKEARFDLIPARPLWELATLYGRGARKYADRNFERGYAWGLSFAAMQRHAWSWWNGEDTDPETGVSHMANVAWHAFALMLFAQHHPEFDNRPLPTPLAITEGTI